MWLLRALIFVSHLGWISADCYDEIEDVFYTLNEVHIV